MRIALLEDEPLQAELARRWLEAEGHACVVFERSEPLLAAARRETFDLFVLDWGLPDVPGDEVLRRLRASDEQIRTPVLFVTNRLHERDIVHALKLGADDYLGKPLRRLEFLARVEALTRRAAPPHEPSERYCVGSLTVSPAEQRIYRQGIPAPLTEKDYKLAIFLLHNLGRLLSRDHILSTVWGHNAHLHTRTVDTHVSRLRTKLGLREDEGWRLTAVYNRGYRLEKVHG